MLKKLSFLLVALVLNTSLIHAQEEPEMSTVEKINQTINGGIGPFVDDIVMPTVFYTVNFGYQGELLDYDHEKFQGLADDAEVVFVDSNDKKQTMTKADFLAFVNNTDKKFGENRNVYSLLGETYYNSGGSVYEYQIPFVLIWLVVGAMFFTVYMGFINIKGFKYAVQIVRGDFTDPDAPKEHGQVSHFQALTTALSGTVGLGNIAGVAVAIAAGGPGATFWMIIAGLLGMSSKFVECTLGVKYRKEKENGEVAGGPMYYLREGLAKRKKGTLGKVLAVFFAIMCVGGSFGGGNMFQANQARAQFSSLPFLQGEEIGLVEHLEDGSVQIKDVESGSVQKTVSAKEFKKQCITEEQHVVGDVLYQSGFFVTDTGFFVFGLLVSIMVGVVIIGGIQKIASVTDKIVPFMCGLYVVCAIIILVANAGQVPAAFGSIMSGAFSAEAAFGGFLGVLIQGFKRAAFSNEAGVGSAAIAHSAVKTEEPITEGLVALLEPFIDTVVVCTMTALVLVITGVYADPNLAGVGMTSVAFESVFGGAAQYILTIAVVLFAFSTMISWSYYGQKAWNFLFGENKVSEFSYKTLFCLFVIVGSILSLGKVVDFSDAMIFAMCFPNILGLYIMSPEIRKDLNHFIARVKSGEIKNYRTEKK